MRCLGSRSDKLAGGGRGRSRGRSGTSSAGAGTLVAHLLTVAGASGEASSLSAQADTALIGPQCPAGHGTRLRQATGDTCWQEVALARGRGPRTCVTGLLSW